MYDVSVVSRCTLYLNKILLTINIKQCLYILKIMLKSYIGHMPLNILKTHSHYTGFLYMGQIFNYWVMFPMAKSIFPQGANSNLKTKKNPPFCDNCTVSQQIVYLHCKLKIFIGGLSHICVFF